MNRKDDHIKFSLNQNNPYNDFDKIRFVHNALSNTSFDEVNLSCTFLDRIIDYPIYINAMTGGSSQASEINAKLAVIAKHFNIPIASGSVSIALRDLSLINSFSILRKNNPTGIVMANIGANNTYIDAFKAIEILNADILQIHLNVVQEMIMPEGDRDFSNYEKNIKEIVSKVCVPVIVKEVGFGMNFNTIEKLKSMGVKAVDISGKGGTNFAIIENERRVDKLNYLNTYGLSTVESLLEAKKTNDVEIFASGGIRNAMDVVKALALGAKAVGMSGYFLKLVNDNSIDDAINLFNDFLIEIKTIMTILGTVNLLDLQQIEIIYDESLISYMMQRKVKL